MKTTEKLSRTGEYALYQLFFRRPGSFRWDRLPCVSGAQGQPDSTELAIKRAEDFERYEAGFPEADLRWMRLSATGKPLRDPVNFKRVADTVLVAASLALTVYLVFTSRM